MQILKPDVDPQRFFERLRTTARRLLMLDYDGTLAPFHPQRDLAAPYPGVRERLAALMAEPRTRLVLVSGRAVREVVQLAGVRPAPEAWGSHGWERLAPDGAYEVGALPAQAAQALAAAQAALEARWAGRLERKPASLAFHLRDIGAEEAETARHEVRQRWEAIARAPGLEVHSFDGGLELRVPGRSKGTAVRQMIAESPVPPACAYLGDDLTDEDAFAAIAPHGVGVLVRPTLRPTAAAWWLQPPQELLDFLDRWLTACGDSP